MSLMTGPARQVHIYLKESDQWQGRPLWLAILEQLKSAGCPGATVLRGMAGYGGHRLMHTAGLVELSSNLPLVITFVEKVERLSHSLQAIHEMVGHSLVVVQEVHIVRGGPRGVFPAVTVADIMATRLATVQAEDSVSEALALMLSRRLRALPVLEGERLVGMLTDYDLLQKGGVQVPVRFQLQMRSPEAVEPASLSVGLVMSRDPVAIRPDCLLAEAAAVMVESDLKRLPVTDPGGRLLGMVARSDLLRTVADGGPEQPGAAESAAAPSASLGSLGGGPVPTADPRTPVQELLPRLLETRRRLVVVLDSESRPVGLITEGDLLRRLGRAVKPGILKSLVGWLRGQAAGDQLELTEKGYAAGDVMSSPLECLSASAGLEEAVNLMITRRYKQVPLVDQEGRLAGMVDRSSVLRALRESTPEQESPAPA